LQFEQALSKARALSLHGRACRQYAFGDDDGHATAWGAMTKIKPTARGIRRRAKRRVGSGSGSMLGAT
jgi:hypothetical protein